jgi:hypothetical protein
MPTSSQSRILSVVDYQLLRKQPNSDVQDGQTKASGRAPVQPSSSILSKRRPYRDDRRSSIESKNNERNRIPSPPPPSSIIEQRQNSDKSTDSKLDEEKSFFDRCVTWSSDFLPARLRSMHRAQRHVKYTHRHQHHQPQFPYIRRGMATGIRSARSALALLLSDSISR